MDENRNQLKLLNINVKNVLNAVER